jgi:hypothetical protein
VRAVSAGANPGKVYASWSCGTGAEIRLMLTVRGISPVIDLRYGELANGRWHPSSRGISFKPSQLQELSTGLLVAAEDIKRLGLADDDYRRAPADASRRRWG